MVVVEEGEAFFIGAKALREFLESRLRGDNIGIYKYGVGAGEPGDVNVFADVTDIGADGAGQLLARLERVELLEAA